MKKFTYLTLALLLFAAVSCTKGSKTQTNPKYRPDSLKYDETATTSKKHDPSFDTTTIMDDSIR